jgi:hypothetical protein
LVNNIINMVMQKLVKTTIYLYYRHFPMLLLDLLID